jgi:hypothetical protein
MTANQVLKRIFAEYSDIDQILSNPILGLGAAPQIEESFEDKTERKVKQLIVKMLKIDQGIPLSDEERSNYNSKLTLNERCLRLKQTAKRREIRWSLTKLETVKLLRRKCAYCGSDKRMGIDRINSNFGYERKNVQPCCVTCNQMKNNLSHEDFIKHVGDIWYYFLITKDRMRQATKAMQEYVEWLDKDKKG